MTNFRRVSTLLVAVALTGTAAVFSATPAFAADDTPGCVTQGEYNAVKKGQTIKSVHATFGTVGRATSTKATREYRICDVPGYNVRVSYRHYKGAWRLASKSANAE